MIPSPCLLWLCFYYLLAVRVSVMLDRYPLQHPPGMEVHFPVANVALMLLSRTAGEDSVVSAYTAISHSSSFASLSTSLEWGSVSPESLLTL